MNDVLDLNEEFTELNRLINLGELAGAVRDLNSKLRHYKDGREIFET